MGQGQQRPSVGRTLIGVSVVLLLVAIALFFWRQGSGSSDATPTSASPDTQPHKPQPVSQQPIRVGVILSHSSAVESGWVGRVPQYGYTSKTLRLRLSDESDIRLYPVIEPGTSTLGELPKVLEQYFDGRQPIDCTDTAAMKQIDVFLASGITNLTPEMLAALTAAVRDDGKGLLIRAWLGVHSPGLTPEVMALNGMREGVFRVMPKDQPAMAKREHPILTGVLPVGGTLRLEPNGLAGFHNGQTLIEFAPSDLLPPLTTQPADVETYVHSPLYTATYGQGKIVGCCWLGNAGDPATKDATRLLTVRSIRWLSGRLPE